ncbi:hypothetical protein GZ77_17355 [Endozoicomonas montiporae]|uniref:3'(2'),5'-bisphosphate nucleotidase CysQ n=2 Tax=Endozoicomonas montiporae TaxID=1027273 RepID=A0A081N1K3_9GAMM|nr:3'(2'),5'-bisphosphate nucleotidase CysQ [Endozoicomonas montiporae]AMO58743.1 3'(2'),5'-bisphosphate nucleotidase [Endozoicomonas montiporae CL-33]KEQ12326.1 hypothetical protein GZ77_17355 [Endozoicomonas montiporae]
MNELIKAVREIARKAGDTILDVYEQQELGIQTKADATPVTMADFRANEVIEKNLLRLDVAYPILSEESTHADLSVRQTWSRYWLVDPLDGTQEFINGNGQFTVNIALMEKAPNGFSYPLFGVVHVPVTNTTYWGGKQSGAFKQVGSEPVEPIQPRALNLDDVIVLGSRTYGTAGAAQFIERLRETYPDLTLQKVGSALKSCLVAEGTADLYPRIGPTSEWDTAAVQGVVEGAGGQLLNPEGERFAYNFKNHLLNSDFLVLGDVSIDWASFWNPDALNALG